MSLLETNTTTIHLPSTCLAEFERSYTDGQLRDSVLALNLPQ